MDHTWLELVFGGDSDGDGLCNFGLMLERGGSDTAPGRLQLSLVFISAPDNEK